MRKLLPLALTLLLLCFPAAAEDARLTLMIYMTGSNLESEYFAATSDIQEMISSRYDQKQVNVLIMTGGTEKWWTPGISADHLSIHRIDRAKLALERDYPLESMASPNPLTALLDYGYTACPADKYALIIWDHGNGPVNGVCMDTLFGGDMLLPAELNAALAASPFGEDNKLEWIGFDACLMANAETAALLAPYAKYMIASQETEPGRGWDYGFLKGIEADATGADTGRRIIDMYCDSAMIHTPGNNITLSLMDLGKIAAVKDASDAFFTALNMQLTAENFSDLSVRRQQAQSVGRAADSESDYDLVDLTSLTSHYAAFAPQEAQALADALSQSVLYSRSNIEGLCGLSVYHPYYNKAAYQSQWRMDYRSAAFSDSYLRYLDTYTGIWLGEQLTSWKGMTPTVALDPVSKVQTISLQLTASQRQNFASAELLVFSVSADTGYGFIYREALGAPDENGVLSIAYSGRQLIQADAQGNAVNAGLSYRLQGSRLVLPGVLTRYSRGPKEEKVMFAYLRPRGDDGELEYLYMDEVLDIGYLNSRHSINLDDWEYYEVLYDNRVPTYAQDGELLPFEEWAESSWYLWRMLDLRQGFRFRFSPTQASNNDFAAILEIRDTQGNLHVTPLIPLQHPAATQLDANRQTLLDNEYCTLTLIGAEAVASELSPAIKLRVEMYNKHTEPLRVRLDYMLLNHSIPSVSPYIDLPHSGVPSGETTEAFIVLPLEAFTQTRTTRAEQLVLFGDVVSDSYQVQADFRSLPLTLTEDFSSIVTLDEEPAIISSCRQNGLTIDILALYLDDDDSLQADVRITNDTGADISCFIFDGCINNIIPTSVNGSLELPAGSTGFTTVRFNNSLSLTQWGKASFCEDLLGGLQVTTIDALNMSWAIDIGDERQHAGFTFDLAQSFAYARQRRYPLGDPLKTLLLYEDEQLSVRLAGIATDQLDVNAVFLYENKTSTDITLKWTHAAANGVAKEFLWGNEHILPANTVSMQYLEVTPDGPDLALPDELENLTLSWALFDADETAVLRDFTRVDVCAPAEENGCFYAEQLSVELLERRHHPSSPIVANSFLLPEDPAQYRVALSVRTDQPAVSAEAHLILQKDGLYIPFVSGIPLTDMGGGLWQGSYSGLYAGVPEDLTKYWVIEDVQSGADGETWSLGLLYTSCYGVHFETISQRNTAVRFTGESATADEMPSSAFPELFTELTTYAGVYIPQRSEAGLLSRLTDMPLKEYTLLYSDFTIPSSPLQFSLLPAQCFAEPLYVLYSFTLPDGSGYSTEPIPYGEAASAPSD